MPENESLIRSKLLPPLIEITRYRGASLRALKIDSFTYHGVACEVNYDIGVISANELPGDQSLTRRGELCVLLAGLGLTMGGTARFLGISENTVKSHRQKAIKAMHISSTRSMGQAVSMLLRSGAVTADRVLQPHTPVLPHVQGYLQGLSEGKTLPTITREAHDNSTTPAKSNIRQFYQDQHIASSVPAAVFYAHLAQLIPYDGQAGMPSPVHPGPEDLLSSPVLNQM